MQIVINIPEDEYNRMVVFSESGMGSTAIDYIINGTILEPHGRLGDLDYLHKKFEANGCNDSNVYRLIKDEPTILEAMGVCE